MEQPALTDDFLALLRLSELLTPDEFSSVERDYLPTAVEPRALATLLVRDGFLTRFRFYDDFEVHLIGVVPRHLFFRSSLRVHNYSPVVLILMNSL